MNRAPHRPSHRTELRAYIRWTRAAGPFWQYVCALPFYEHLTQRPGPVPLLSPARLVSLPLGARLVKESILPLFDSVAGRIVLFLDLSVERGLSTTTAFHEAGFLVVPVISRWPGENPLLPVESILAQLMWLAPQLQPPAIARGVVFVLDGERQVPISDNVSEQRFDNRYEYIDDNFPAAWMLQDWGASAVGLVADYHLLPEDMASLSEALNSAGLPVSRVWVPAK